MVWLHGHGRRRCGHNQPVFAGRGHRWFEIAIGLVILAWPWAALLLFVVVWKLGTEWLRLLAGEPMWEFIEREGSYAAPLADVLRGVA